MNTNPSKPFPLKAAEPEKVSCLLRGLGWYRAPELILLQAERGSKISSRLWGFGIQGLGIRSETGGQKALAVQSRVWCCGFWVLKRRYCITILNRIATSLGFMQCRNIHLKLWCLQCFLGDSTTQKCSYTTPCCLAHANWLKPTATKRNLGCQPNRFRSGCARIHVVELL